MKLASRHVPAATKLPSNELYEKYQVEINLALRSPGDRDPARESITSEEYAYELTPEEIEFYERIYVPCRLYDAADDEWIATLFDDEQLKSLCVGVGDKDLLDFVCPETDKRLMSLVAPVGWGKTVLLKHVWFYLIGKSDLLRKTIVPIYVAVDQLASIFKNGLTPAQIAVLLDERLLRPRLMKIVRPFTGVRNEDFWRYVVDKTDDFAELGHDEDAVRLIEEESGDGGNWLAELWQERRLAKRSTSFPYSAARYMIDVLGKLPVLILDNVDPLPIDVHETVLQEAVRLAEAYNLRTIISMRDTTFDALAADPEGPIGTNDIVEVRMASRNVKEYLKRRVTIATELIGQRSVEVSDGHGKRLVFTDSETTLKAMVDLMLTEDSAGFLDFITYHNLRFLNAYVREYLSTGYVDKQRLAWAVAGKVVGTDATSEIPFWVLLSAVLTCNHETHYSGEDCPNKRLLNTIVNVYCNGEHRLNPYSIRLHLLNYLERKGSTSFEKLVRDYTNLAGGTIDENRPALRQAIFRFLQGHLVESPASYGVHKPQEVDLLNPIRITDTGAYYRKVLSTYFEYLTYMKDDTDLGENPRQIRDSVEVKSLAGRYEQVCAFLEFLFENEDGFLKSRSQIQRERMMADFCCVDSGSPYTALRPVQAMVVFGEHRDLDAGVVGRFEALQADITENSKALVPPVGKGS